MSTMEQTWAIETLFPDDPHWQNLCNELHTRSTLATLVLSAWQMGLWVAKVLVEHQLSVRSQALTSFGNCPICGMSLVSKGFAPRAITHICRCSALEAAGQSLSQTLSR